MYLPHSLVITEQQVFMFDVWENFVHVAVKGRKSSHTMHDSL